MGEVVAFILELIFRVLFEALFEGIFYGLKKVWFWLTGQGGKAQKAKATHQDAVLHRRQVIDDLRRERSRRRKLGKK